ncbi:hypothetical protein AVEN_53831-1 [Araneus ventricosus]|uniref:Transposable element Tc1 transposase n=1 Tax=Araneus ventricosus TaxID=182803 RepID=A0A4Y2F1J2_ARAVE|nr:hypothetical protein AVEN_53831-1 [Araneus ventricosus]
MVDKDISFWESVIFVDESKFNIFASDGRITVWRKPNEELNPKKLLSTVKHGGGGIMVWGCFAASGMGNLVFIENIMDQHKPLWPSGKISASEPKRSRFEISVAEYPLKILHVWVLSYAKSYVVDKRPPAGVVRKFGEGMRAHVPSSSFDRGSKLRGSVLK